MDADGQHLPEDMIKLLEFAEMNHNTLVLGTRMVGSRMPLKSRLGNLITRGVFHLVSGVKVSDTQTGLRALLHALGRRAAENLKRHVSG